MRQADTSVSDDNYHARSILRSMIVRIGALAVAGVRDRAAEMAPLGDALLLVREQARQRRDWTASDQVRDALMSYGVEVRDTPTGPAWSLLP